MPTVPLTLQPIGKVTRFLGFCRRHDKQLFAPIEDQEWRASREQCLLVTYRAVCAEIWKMQWKVRHLLPTMRELDRGRGPEEQKAINEHCDLDESGSRAALAMYETEKEACEDLIQRGDFGGIEAYTVELLTRPPVASHRALLTRLDTDHATRTVEVGLGSFSLLPLPDGGRFVVAWRGNEEPLIARTLAGVNDDDLPGCLLEFVLTFSEDTFLSPAWYDGLATSEQEAVHSILRSSPRSTGLGLESLLAAVSWKIKQRGRIP